MIRYLAKGSPQFFAVVVGGGLIAILLVFLVVQAMPMLGWMLWALTTVGVLTGAALWYRNEFAKVKSAEDNSRIFAQQAESEPGMAELRRRAERRGKLMAKYSGDTYLVEHIMQGWYWQGQTAGQLRDALGSPAEIVSSVLQGCRREIWKFHPVGADRHALWVTVEMETVVRWEERAEIHHAPTAINCPIT